MNFLKNKKFSKRTSIASVLVTVAIALLMLPVVAVFSSSSNVVSGPLTLPSTTFVAAPPPGTKGGPDDITSLAIPGLDGGKLVIWTAYQNGINPNGTAGYPGGPIQSTVVGYDAATGKIVRMILVTGKVDGLTADPKSGHLIATVNEDNKSALNVIYPVLGATAVYTYSPNPAVMGNGGTDSIAIRNGQIFISHSNPNDVTQPTEYRVKLFQSNLTVFLTPVFYDNSMALNVLTHKQVSLALADPDSNYFMPSSSPRFAGTLATIGQADGQLIFASAILKTPVLKVLNVTDNKASNVPIDGIAVTTSGTGTLFVVDASANTIVALNTKGWPSGTVFVGEPKDKANPLVGVINLNTGVITPLTNAFVSPKGLLFIAG